MMHNLTIENNRLFNLLIVLGIVFLTFGCGKKEAPLEGKTAAVAETKEASHKGGDGNEEPGVVTLSEESKSPQE